MSRRRKDYSDSVEEMHGGGKNKGLAILIVLIIALAGLGAAATYWFMSSPSGGYISSGDGGSSTPTSPSGTTETPQTVINAQLSVKYAPLSSVNKKVIGELFVTTTCPYCAKTEGDLERIEGQRDDFYFVTFVADKNREAYQRYTEISQNQGTPDTEFDGGYRSELGAVNSSKFIDDIEACKQNPGIPAEINAQITSESGGKASVSIDVSIADRDFNGNIRAFVIDKKSQWLNVNNERIPNAFVGYLLDESISLSGGTVDKTGQWRMDGTKSFSELAIVIAVYDSGGHALQAYRIDL